jgi:hypothetical protein
MRLSFLGFPTFGNPVEGSVEVGSVCGADCGGGESRIEKLLVRMMLGSQDTRR